MGDESKDVIDGMAAVMAESIAKLCLPCIEQRCKQFLRLLYEEGALGKPEQTFDRGFQRNENNEGDTVII